MKSLVKVEEIFFSIQGEGLMSGVPMIFVRFHGCNLNCSFCDTRYAKSGDPKRIIPIEKLLHTIAAIPCKNVCITGGEPFVQKDAVYRLSEKLFHSGYFVTVETNGTIKNIDFSKLFLANITLSPKLMSKINPMFFEKADEVKCPVGSTADIDRYEKLLNEHEYDGVRLLQPIDNKPENIQLIVGYLKGRINRWRMSIQLHKTLKIR